MISKDAINNNRFTKKDREFISRTVDRLGKAPMTPTAHGYKEEINETVWESASRSEKEHPSKHKDHPAISLMAVVLAANRDYNRQVVPHIKRMKEEYPKMTLKELDSHIKENNSAEEFKKIWGHKDSKKLQTLKDLLEIFLPQLGQKDSKENDFIVLSKWAKNTDYRNKDDPVLKVNNVGIATFQHLRMTFGVDTVKPDLWVKQVLLQDFGLKLSSLEAILAVERLAALENLTTFFLDKLLVKYGSGKAHEQHSSTNPKKVKLCLDQDILDALRATGKGWQTRVNDLLRGDIESGRLAELM